MKTASLPGGIDNWTITAEGKTMLRPGGEQHYYGREETGLEVETMGQPENGGMPGQGHGGENGVGRNEGRAGHDEKLVEMGRAAGSMVHELNNILGAMLGYTQLALEVTEKDTDMYRYLKRIFDAGFKGSGLVKEVLVMRRELDRKGGNLPAPSRTGTASLDKREPSGGL